MRLALVLVHAAVAAGWLGGMLYSLFVVTPKAARFFGRDDDGREAFLTTMASGNRWKVVAMIGVLAMTGVTLVLTDPRASSRLPFYAVKAALLLVATLVFAHVSWRLWPRRLFALAEERPALLARFRRAAYTLVVLVGAAFVLGVAATQPH
ncbi:hypothetical protein [Actinopolymorpha pittospori]